MHLTRSFANRMRPVAVAGVLMTLVLGCAAVGPATASGPTSVDRTVLSPAREFIDLPYITDGHERQKLDLFLPESTSPTPLVLWVHGGGWDAGDKKNCPARRLVERGYAVASINYRYSRHAIFPAQIQDVKAAVRFLRANAREYNLDPDRFAAWGASAGGHLVALLGVSDGVADLEGELGDHRDVPSNVQAVIDWFGASELRKPDELPLNNNRIKLLGGRSEEKPDLAALASPLAFVSPGDPPFLIMHGDKDTTVALEHSIRLEQALREAGVPVKLIVLPGAGHGGDRFHEPAMQAEVDEFLDRTLRSTPAR